MIGTLSHTEFPDMGGLSFIDWVWKLNGLRDPASGGGGPRVDSELNDGVPRPAEDGIGDAIDPKRLGKVSLRVERELESKVIVEWSVRGPPLIPRPSSGSSGIGVGGVGVRGGAGIGRLEAIAAVYGSRRSMCRGRIVRLKYRRPCGGG